MTFPKANKQCLTTQIGWLGVFMLLFANIFTISAQETLVIGQVFDENREPLAGVSVYFKGTYIGMQTNEEGYFMVRNTGSETTVVFALLGYEQQELKLQRGQNAGTEIVMKEKLRWLPEVFVLPGENPALELMRKVRLRRNANNVSNLSDFQAVEISQNRAFLMNDNYAATRSKLWKRLAAGNLSANDSVLLVPLLNVEEKFQISGKNRTMTDRNIFETDKTVDFFAQQLLQIAGEQLDFYHNTVMLFGRAFVSPLANVGNAYYKFYLADSVLVDKQKQYEVHFRSTNKKNLAFNGQMWIDSATLALTKIEAELPAQANINFLKNLQIKQDFSALNAVIAGDAQSPVLFYKNAEFVSVNLEYRMFSDTAQANSRLYVMRKSAFAPLVETGRAPSLPMDSDFSDEEIQAKMAALQNSPMFKAAMYLADIFLTGNAKMGKIDIGNVKNILRISELEGLRLALPLQTNETLWKNFSVGGHLSYGFGNQQFKYSAFAKWKLPTKRKRLFSVGYFNDYRRIDYDYNDFLFRENPFAPEDADFFSTIFSFQIFPEK